MLVLLAKMLHILVLCPVLLIGGVQTLTIDSQLGTSIEDCFERISIGEQLPSSAIYRNVSELTTRECEQICKQDKQCQAYDYGVGAKGNATCDLSTHSEKEVKEKSLLTRHPDYDVYVRRFQCEQAPPKPIQPLLDEPEDGPVSNDKPFHRPVFRPDVDDRPLTGDYLVSSDIDPYNLGSKPQSYRPDDISQKPAYDVGPSYGDHKPQEIPYPDRPYRPERPQDAYRPNDPYRPERPNPYRPNDPYRPERPDPYSPNQDAYKPNRPDPYRPQSEQKPKPDSNDVLTFDNHGKPRPGYPLSPETLRPEKPNYNYITRPNRRPRPEDGYNKPTRPVELSNNQYGQNSGPVGPPYKPQRPEKPAYNYNSQYAGSYGQNSENDNSVYVEIYDPPRPYVPIKDRPVQHDYDQGFLGYGTYSSQNSYTQNSGSITELGYDHNIPNVRPQKPYGQNEESPGYGIKPINEPHKGSSQSYGHDYFSLNGQGSYGFDGNKRPGNLQNSNKRPNDKYKPHNQNSYDGNQNSYGGNQESYGTNHGSYGSSHSQGQSNYGLYGDSNSPSYNQDNGEAGYQKPQKPSYNKPSYNNDKGDYGNQGSYGGNYGFYESNQGSYGNHGYHNSHKGTHTPAYSSSQGSYGQNSYGQDSYGFQEYGSQSFGSQGSYGSSQTHGGSYGGNKGSYGSNQGSYGTNQGDYGSNQGSYGSNNAYGSLGGYGNRPVYDYEKHKPGYGNEKPYDTPKPEYGNPKPDYNAPKPDYGIQSPGYDTPNPGYGSQKPDYNTPKPGYGSQEPGYDTPRPGYGGQTSGYDSPKPGYASQTTGYDTPKPGYESHKPNYDNQRPGYGSQKPVYVTPKPGYGNQKPDYDPPKPGYGSQTPGYDNAKPGYGNDRPDPGYTKPDNQPGYGDEKPDDTGYGSNSNRPNIKPVYEYEIDKPANVPTYLTRPGGEVVTSRPVVIGDYERPGYKDPGISYAACFRRVLAGRRALRSFVRKVVPCERIEDCRQECALEKRFHCESFNYRLDQSFRGKGLCELMTKPIEAFDQQRDFVDDKNYDFYEVDRNSLEPNCPETLRGPGLLHSGFLSSKPDLGDRRMDRPHRVDQRPNRVDQRPNRVDQRPNRVDHSGWRDRHGWAAFDRFSYDDRRLYDDRRQGNRGHEEHYVPYQIGQARTEEDNTDWGQYGGNYGGQYYKDRNDYHKSISHWGLSSRRPTDFRKSHSFDYHSLGKNLDFGLTRNDFNDIHIEDKSSRYGYGSWKRGRWNNSGVTNVGFEGFLEGRGESNEDVNGGSHGDNECFSKRRPGMSLKSGAIRRSLISRSVVECEASCFGEREFKCVSYSYRYSTSRGTDNCFLSERPYRGLEMSADSGSDVYAMPLDKGCSGPSSRPWVESECFWHVRSDTSVSGGAVKAALTVAGLGACEAECIRAQGFFCRGFSFRFDAPTIGDEDIHNCILTGSPTTRLSGADSHGHELYARGNYGRGCEPAVYDDSHNADCYLQYDKAAKLTGPAIRGQARVKDEQTCGTACTEAPFRCLSFSYNNNSPPPTDNCFLSEVRQWDLRRGVDYTHSEDDWLFAFDLFNSRCWRHVHNEEHSSELPHPIEPLENHFHESGPPEPPSGPGYLPDSPPEISYIPESGPPSGPTGPYKPYPDRYPSYEASGPAIPEKTYPIESYKPLGPIDFLPSEPDRYKPGIKPDFRPLEVIPFKPQYPDPEPFIRPEPPSLRPDRPFRPTEYPPSFQPGFRPGLKPGDRPGYLPEGRPNQRPQKPGFQGDRDNGPIEASWRHYTVSGFPCRTGTTCAQNKIVGYWACEPEGGEIGSWDYCCAPTHRCGYSEGFNKPWCYVGDTKDQWRPCSEKYYPYHHHNVPHPSQGHRDPPKSRPWRDSPNTPNTPWPVKAPPPPPDYIPHWDKPPGPYLSESDRKYWDDLYRDGPKAYYDKYGNPLPGYSRVPTENRPYIRYRHNNGPPTSGQWVPVSDDPPPVSGLGAARYWPVAYLHRGPPPNMTYFRHHGIKPTTAGKDTTTPSSDDRPESRDDDGVSLDEDRSNRRNEGRIDDNRSERDKNNGNSRGNNDRSSYNSRGVDDSKRNHNDSDEDEDSRGNNESSRDNSDTFRSNNNSSRRKSDDSRDNSDDSSDYDDKFRENNTHSKNNDSFRKGNNNSRNNNGDGGNDRPRNDNRDEESTRGDKKINDSKSDDIFNINIDKTTSKSITTEAPVEKTNNSDVEFLKPEDMKTMDLIKGIDDKLDDFSKSIEVLDIEDAKVEKLSDLKTLEAEERQIEAIGRLLANRRGSQITLEKRSQKELDAKNIAVDKDITDFNFGNRFKTNERRGVIKRISKDEIERDRADKSLEVSETTYIRPPRVLSTTDNIRKAIVNGKTFYDATIRDQRDLFANNTRKPKNLRRNENAPSVLNNSNFGKKKVIRTRNTNPVRRVKRVYRKRYNPGEVRRRLLERDRSKNSTDLNKGL